MSQNPDILSNNSPELERSKQKLFRSFTEVLFEKGVARTVEPSLPGVTGLDGASPIMWSWEQRASDLAEPDALRKRGANVLSAIYLPQRLGMGRLYGEALIVDVVPHEHEVKQYLPVMKMQVNNAGLNESIEVMFTTDHSHDATVEDIAYVQELLDVARGKAR